MISLIGQGAEAKIFKADSFVTKHRVVKSYRLSVIDDRLRKQRTNREAKILKRLSVANIFAPELLNVDVESMKIDMSFVEGKKLKDVLTPGLAKEVGRIVGKLHDQDIVHGDLTTSNMIFNKNIFLIDFGLSFFSSKLEDKAVDLHVLDRALESSHHDIYDVCMKNIIAGYKETNSAADSVLDRLNVVSNRGRHKR